MKTWNIKQAIQEIYRYILNLYDIEISNSFTILTEGKSGNITTIDIYTNLGILLPSGVGKFEGASRKEDFYSIRVIKGDNPAG